MGSKISDLPALVADRYFAACALVIALPFTIDSSIGQDEPRTTAHKRRHAAQRTFLHEARTDLRGPSDESARTPCKFEVNGPRL